MAELKSKDNLPEEILVALEELDKLSQDPNMREQALNMEMWIRDQIVLLNMAKNAESEGIEKGIVKGIKLTAKKMKDRGMETDIIVDITGLDFETIEKL